MDKNPKYIVYTDRLTDVPVLVMFPWPLKHSNMAMALGEITSAGFVNLDTMECYGRSTGLQMDSKPVEDTKLLRDFYPTGRASA